GGWIEKERGGDKRWSIDLQHIINLIYVCEESTNKHESIKKKLKGK
ncbi:18940_t:CDS:2, partial [Racocetra persica]